MLILFLVKRFNRMYYMFPLSFVRVQRICPTFKLTLTGFSNLHLWSSQHVCNDVKEIICRTLTCVWWSHVLASRLLPMTSFSLRTLCIQSVNTLTDTFSNFSVFLPKTSGCRVFLFLALRVPVTPSPSLSVAVYTTVDYGWDCRCFRNSRTIKPTLRLHPH